MRGFLERNGEHAVYEAAKTKLDERIAALHTQGIDVPAQVLLLQSLRSRVKKLCLSEEYLERYRMMIHGEGYQQHQSNNKVRRASYFTCLSHTTIVSYLTACIVYYYPLTPPPPSATTTTTILPPPPHDQSTHDHVAS